MYESWKRSSPPQQLTGAASMLLGLHFPAARSMHFHVSGITVDRSSVYYVRAQSTIHHMYSALWLSLRIVLAPSQRQPESAVRFMSRNAPSICDPALSASGCLEVLNTTRRAISLRGSAALDSYFPQSLYSHTSTAPHLCHPALPPGLQSLLSLLIYPSLSKCSTPRDIIANNTTSDRSPGHRRRKPLQRFGPNEEKIQRAIGVLGSTNDLEGDTGQLEWLFNSDKNDQNSNDHRFTYVDQPTARPELTTQDSLTFKLQSRLNKSIQLNIWSLPDKNLFTQRNTILIDDSILKASAQTLNMEVPEFAGTKEQMQSDFLREGQQIRLPGL
ncbi:hypothetical protein K491DRAFT_677594 [Lophiostoma macrostomum CBS 122681]|uniref:FCP1 homology domain-containing protein n=1 Tax=Lophiostoma macrostomum CBS 122681 TaxID=1314788 RepID=A0A6A6TDJ1_9PLEO|nr:hypothetical protein K491DRAFT_677594 [Lophiostoma macrostomum CBS 122681]